jgi:hypothetical protein
MGGLRGVARAPPLFPFSAPECAPAIQQRQSSRRMAPSVCATARPSGLGAGPLPIAPSCPPLDRNGPGNTASRAPTAVRDSIACDPQLRDEGPTVACSASAAQRWDMLRFMQGETRGTFPGGGCRDRPSAGAGAGGGGRKGSEVVGSSPTGDWRVTGSRLQGTQRRRQQHPTSTRSANRRVVWRVRGALSFSNAPPR